ncbi:hypothetical protein [Robbsia sp. KACC 23696]|uniref:hypothetical protein n=1 Tax=Robbsia sp. KACC 23696 TaxID=3149231 RepID=UPI00325A6AF7
MMQGASLLAERFGARWWIVAALIGFAIAALSWTAAVGMLILSDGAMQRHEAEQDVRHHRMEAIVVDVARGSAAAAGIMPIDRVDGLSAQLQARVRGDAGTAIRLVDPVGRIVASAVPPGSTFAPLLSLTVENETGDVVAYAQGDLAVQALSGPTTLLADGLRRGGVFWRGLLAFACAMLLLGIAAWRYAWRVGPVVRDTVTMRGVDALVRADYRERWRAAGAGSAIGGATRGGIDYAGIVSRVLDRLVAHRQALRVRADVLDRTETDPTAPARRARCIADAAGNARYPAAAPDIRHVVAVGAQARWFSLLCGTGAGGVAALLAYAAPSIWEGIYGAFCLVAGWGVHRLWHADASDADTGLDNEDEKHVDDSAMAGVASVGMRASGVALWMAVALASIVAAQAWPALTTWPAVLLPAMLSVCVGGLLRAAVLLVWALQCTTRDDRTYLDVDHVEGKARRLASSPLATVIGVALVGPGLSGALASGWPFLVVASAVVCLPILAAVQAWRWQSQAGPWQRSGRLAEAPFDADPQRNRP